MEDLLHALVLGVVQGMTEFIPVSSSGHLVLVPWLLGWQSPGLVFDTTAHLGTLVGVLFYFRRDVGEILGAWFGGWASGQWKDPAAKMGWLLIVGTIPAGLVGLVFNGFVESLFSRPAVVAIALLVTGLILVLSEKLGRRILDIRAISLRHAVVVGFAQAVALIPGMSRSGATIAAGLGMGLTRAAAARFSFLLSMPIIAAAGLYQFTEVLQNAEPAPEVGVLIIGFVASLVSGYLCVRFLLAYLQRGTLYVFAVYCWAVGALALALSLSRGGLG